jgi:hypothetical protein
LRPSVLNAEKTPLPSLVAKSICADICLTLHVDIMPYSFYANLMNETNNSNGSYHIIPTFFLIVLAVTSFVLYRSEQVRDEKIIETFSVNRMNLASGGLQAVRSALEKDYPDLFKDCANRGEYDTFIDSDSRALTASEIRRALDLHRECGHYFSNKGNVTLDFFLQDIKQLASIAHLLNDGNVKDSAMSISDYWQQIYDLEREYNTIYGRMVDIQESYWSEELNKAIGLITAQEREANIGALNYEANQKLERLANIREKLQEIREKEFALYEDMFSTSTEKD